MFTSTLRAVLREVIVDVVTPQFEQARAESARLQAAIEQLDRKLDKGMERLDKRIDDLGQRLDARIDHLTHEVGALRTSVEMVSTIARRVERLEDRVFLK